MPPMHILVQDVLMRDADPRAAAAAAGHACTVFSAPAGNRDRLDTVLTSLADALGSRRPVLWCSLAVAARIRRAHPRLLPGLALPDDFLRHHVYSSLLDDTQVLNSPAIYLPWGKIRGARNLLRYLARNGDMPETIFVRPDSPFKPFTGMTLPLDTPEALADACTITASSCALHGEEMCVLAPARHLPTDEYRVWIVDGIPVTWARYGWSPGSSTPGGPVPRGLMEAAATIARRLAWHEQTYTADFVACPEWRLVELNALSTSGLYTGADMHALIGALDAVFV
mgnify:CR=1 FL=1